MVVVSAVGVGGRELRGIFGTMEEVGREGRREEMNPRRREVADLFYVPSSESKSHVGDWERARGADSSTVWARIHWLAGVLSQPTPITSKASPHQPGRILARRGVVLGALSDEFASDDEPARGGGVGRRGPVRL